MTGWPILTLTTFLPLVGAAFIFTIRGARTDVVRNVRNVALWTTTVTFILSLFVLGNFDASQTGLQLEDRAAWIPAFNISYHLGVDGISIWFVVLTTFLMPLGVLASWDAITGRVKEFMIALLVLETMLIGLFSAMDLVLFYFFFEGALIPMFIIIGVWGGTRRVYSAFKFFLFTLFGSVLMLVAIVTLYGQVGTTDYAALAAHRLPSEMQHWLWLAFFASFAIKVPMWPLHTWLPDAYVEAPTAGSAILAGVFSAVGGYGFLRFSVPFFPEATAFFTPLVFALSVVAIVYASLVALVQEDMKRLIAYASIANMGLVTIGIFTLNPQGVTGSIFLMLSHGVITAGLFLMIGALYDRLRTCEIARYGGVVHAMPAYAVLFMVMVLAAVGLPGTSGFVGEFLSLLGAFKVNTWVAVLSATGIVFAAAYMLVLFRRVMLGKLENSQVAKMPDLTPREVLVFAPLVVLVLWMGIYPSTFLDPTTATVDQLIATYQKALADAGATSVAAQ